MINATLDLKPEATLGNLSTEAFNLSTHLTGVSGYNLSTESIISTLRDMVDNMSRVLNAKTISYFKPNDDKLIKVVSENFKGNRRKNFSSNTVVPVPEGFNSDILTWIQTLKEGYVFLTEIETTHIDSLITFLKKVLNKPDTLKEISKFGGVSIPQLEKHKKRFYSMYRGKATETSLNKFYPPTMSTSTVENEFESLAASRAGIFFKSIETKIDEVNELVKELVNRYSLQLSSSKGAVKDLSTYIHVIAEYVSFLAVLDSSYASLERCVQAVANL